jgi:hypothetical protein
MFGDVVPIEWRGYVAGVRNSLLAVVTVITTIACGEILIRLPFTPAYQIVFFIGTAGAAVSTYHIWFLRAKPVLAPGAALRLETPGSDRAVEIVYEPKPTDLRGIFQQALQKIGIRADVLKGAFGRNLGLLFFFHMAQFLAIPLFSIFTVDVLHFSDQSISFGTAMFNISMFIGSSQFARMAYRMGNRKVIGIGVVLLGSFPALVALSRGPGLYIFANAISGFAWAMVGSAIFNYLLEMAPENDRPAHMAWYNLALNAAILVGSLGGPFIAGTISIVGALFLFALLRLLSGIAILRWG